MRARGDAALIVSLVRFRSGLADDAVQATFEDRADRYQEVPGLVQKFYLRFRGSAEFGAVYVWESEEAFLRFRETDLARTIPLAYSVEGTPSTELADVALIVAGNATSHGDVAVRATGTR
jgi:heme-degrading monooxygenase HmoA